MKLLRLYFAGSWFIPYGNRSLERPFHIGAAIVRPAGRTTRAKYGGRGRVLPSVGPKNVVPDGRTYAEAGVIVMKVVPQMVLFETIQNTCLHREMVNRVVNSVVTNVAGREPGPNRWRGMAKGQKEKTVK